MRKHRPKDVKGITEGHSGAFAGETVLEIGTTVNHIVLSPSRSPSLFCVNSLVEEFPIATPPGSMGRVLFGCLD